MTTAHDLAVVIPTRNRWELLRRTLAALDAQTVSGAEVVVVVDGQDQSPPAPEDLPGPEVRLVVQDHSGPGVARSRGVEATSRPLILFLGDDMIPLPDLIERHLDRHDRQPDEEVVVLGHVAWHPEVAGDPILRWLDRCRLQFDYPALEGLAGQDVGWGRFYTANVSLKRSLFQRVGGFDPDFFFLYEDTDLGYRLGQAGMGLIYEPDARVLHLHRYDLDRLRGRFETTALGERLMAEKHPWFEPYFLPMMQRAAARDPVARFWNHLIDLPDPLGRYARGRSDLWHLQQVADAYLASWDRASHVLELRRYLGDEFESRLIVHHDQAVRDEAQGAEDEEEFYLTSRAYLYDLTVFAMSGTKVPYHRELERHVPPGGRVLDYGCGIGTDGLRLLERGYDVHFADFDNPSTRYLQWRLQERGHDAPVHDIERDDVPGGFDAAFAFDVIEHVDDPFDFLERLERRAQVVVVNLLEDTGHGHDHEELLHRELPVEELIVHARDRGLISHTVHHGGRSHLVVYRGSAGRSSSDGGNSGRSPGGDPSSTSAA